MGDADRDGQHDAAETRADLRDTDRDGLADGLEAGVTTGVADPDGLGPPRGTGAGFVADSNPATTTDPTRPDTDGDGLSDGAVDPGESDPRDAASVPAQVHPVPALGPALRLVLALGLAGCAVRRLHALL
ncbi:MAG: hypothetical protein AB7Q01_15400 [Gammaproteobacteria bacterium]